MSRSAAAKWIPDFAWFTLVGGVEYSIEFTMMWLVSMNQMLIMSRSGKVYGNPWETDLKALRRRD